MTVKITESARTTAKALDMPVNTSTSARVSNLKRVSVGPVDADGKGQERWEAEFDGLGNTEFVVSIPKRTNNMKDPAKRMEKVRALAMKQAEEELAELVKQYG